MSRTLIGTTGRITGTVRPGGVGEIQLPFGGGSNTYLAYPYDGVSTITVGKTATIIEFAPPCSVYVREVAPEPGVMYENMR
jgi:hypothetical protein